MAKLFDFKRTCAVLFLLAMLLPNLASCADNTAKEDDTANDAAGTSTDSEAVENETLPRTISRQRDSITTAISSAFTTVRLLMKRLPTFSMM